MKQLNFDFVIIGSGLAGLAAAVHAAEYGRVAVITKSASSASNSWYAQGGVAAAVDEDDSPEFHFDDTLVAGRGLCDADAVNVLVTEGRDRIKEMIDWGMQFDSEGGQPLLGLEGGHSKRRIFHAGGDSTGKAMTDFMLQKAIGTEQITFFEYTAAIRLLVKNGECCGVHAFDYTSQENIAICSQATIMATGGLSRIYCRSTNPHTATGDGVSLAWEAGAQLADMEFVQFHPTALNIPDQDAFLISEAVRGEGAWLLNEKGERFMKDLHPLAELAPRDVVAFAIFKEINKSESDHVYLSLKHLDADKIKARFSTIYSEVLKSNIDITQDPIPIAPAAHYMVGGVKTDLYGRTNITGLFACGEVASTGVMGANRLASNSLLECLVFGYRAAQAASKLKPMETCCCEEFTPIQYSEENENTLVEYKNKIAQILSQKVGIVRSEQGLREAIEAFEQMTEKFKPYASSYNLTKLRKLADISLLVARAAYERKESRGGHIREDYREENEAMKLHSIQERNKELVYKPVVKDRGQEK
ncbi:L-aspartate oxidase [Puteibacter caeruleilacunae]|nr:L-aspartate oxidase [Puteibacter caeruleilacunae]